MNTEPLCSHRGVGLAAWYYPLHGSKPGCVVLALYGISHGPVCRSVVFRYGYRCLNRWFPSGAAEGAEKSERKVGFSVEGSGIGGAV